MVILLGLSLGAHYDLKKNVAYSTSLHLTLMLLFTYYGEYRLVVLYILVHGIVKRQIFQSSGYVIHAVGSQDLRVIGGISSYLWMMVRIFMLSALPGMVILAGKEQVVVSVLSSFCVLFVISSLWYTKFFVSKMNVGTHVGEIVGMYVVVIMLLSLHVVRVLGEMNMRIVVLRWFMFVVFSRRILAMIL